MIPAPGPHGGDAAAIARSLGRDPASMLDLSLSMNPFAPDVAPVIARHVDAVRRYPDPAAATRALADAIGVPPERLLLTNGGSEAIDLVARRVGGGVVAEPEFSLHPRGAGAARWRSNPNNPTGVLARRAETADVWDEAFYPLATGEWTRRDDGALIVGSLTKVFSCPGVRIGYVIADDVDRFATLQPAWSVNGLALAVVCELVDLAELAAWRDRIAGQRSELCGVLAAAGLAVTDTDAPWVLVDRPDLRAALAPHGVVVRDCASFGLAGVARIAVPDDDGLARLTGVLGHLEAPR